MSADFSKVDQYELDREWVQQPELYFKYAQIVVDAEEVLDKAKEEKLQRISDKEEVIAELDRDIRKDPACFGVDKITEKTVENAIILQRRYKIASHAVFEAQRLVNEAQSAVKRASVVTDTLDHRKKTLEKLVDLFLANYFSKPQSKNHKERMEKVETDSAFGHGRKRPEGMKKRS